VLSPTLAQLHEARFAEKRGSRRVFRRNRAAARYRGAVSDNGARRDPPRENWPAVAAALGARMDACRLSQQELASQAGVSVATLRVLQRGAGERRVQNTTLAAVSRALGLPGDHLLRVLLDQPVPEVAAEVGVAWATPDAQWEILRALRRIELRIDLLTSHLTAA
jgi:transcriptional regulator with XRE-family HTH domain